MREYSYHATDASIEALRLLREPWVSATFDGRALTVFTSPGAVVRISVERADVEPMLEASRIRADLLPADDVPAAPDLPVGELASGRNDVVLFNGESWVEAAQSTGNGDGTTPPQTMQFTGRAGQRPATAVVVCTTTDAVVVAASTGQGMLIRIGVRPLSLSLETDRTEIARFLVQRGYETE